MRMQHRMNMAAIVIQAFNNKFAFKEISLTSGNGLAWNKNL